MDKRQRSLSKLLMMSSGIVNGLFGLALIFIPGELHNLISSSLISAEQELLIQLGGAAILGFGLLNYYARSVLLGGIYGKPILAGNWIFHLVAAFTLVRAVFEIGFPAALIMTALLYLLFAGGFLVLNFTSAVEKD